jgi:uncharacterized membrane protein
MSETTVLSPPPSIDALLGRRAPMQNVHRLVQDRLSPLNRLAVWTTEHVGSMGFFLAILVWTVAWLGWNLLAPVRLRFDPPMGFVFWLFISNLIQILLMPLIMVGQNIQGMHSEARAQSDLDVNVKAEEEIEVILRHLEYQNAMLIALVTKLGIELQTAAPGEPS